MTTFNFEDALKQLQSGKKLTGTDGILTPLIKQLTEAALQAELEQHLQQQDELASNRKNGYTSKTIASERWTMPIANWGQTMAQLSIHFQGRLEGIIKI